MVEISLQWPDQTYNCDATSLKTVAKFYALTWSNMADPVTYVTGPTKIDHVSANYTELYFR